MGGVCDARSKRYFMVTGIIRGTVSSITMVPVFDLRFSRLQPTLSHQLSFVVPKPRISFGRNFFMSSSLEI